MGPGMPVLDSPSSAPSSYAARPCNVDRRAIIASVSPRAIGEIERKAAEQQRIAQLKIDAFKKEYEALT